jgi:ATP phosphoribosyltransferase
MSEVRLRLAIQKSGRLSEPSLSLLAKCGLRFSWRNRLVSRAEGMPVEAMLVRDDDIPRLVAEGLADLGVVGWNLVAEHRAVTGTTALADTLPLGFGHCRLAIAVRHDLDYSGPASLAGSTIATTYPGLVGAYLSAQGVIASIVSLSGSVELAARLGMADAVADLVVTGSTLAEHALKPVETILASEAVLIGQDRLTGIKRALAGQLIQRLQGVMAAAESKYIMLHAPTRRLDQIKALLPGAESPTVLPLEGMSDVVAVHAVCRESVFWETMERLKEVGASSILVMPIEKMMP